MSKFRSKLARYNTICCEQVMPVAVVPVCAIPTSLATPICEVKSRDCSTYPAHLFNRNTPIQIVEYNPSLPDPLPGTILTLSSGILPAGYLLCDGQEVSRIMYSALFGILGTTYGEGDGSTTFILPNLINEETSNIVTYIIKT